MILYEGESRLSKGQPIVAIATDKSENTKTGPMVQVWILHAELDPFLSLRSGVNSSICGHCRFQGQWNGKKLVDRVCYVNLGQAPLAVYRKYKRGGYRPGKPHQLAGKKIRLGAYGDPAALPIKLIEQLCRVSSGWTGYTHQVRQASALLKRYCMASADTIEEARQYEAQGWRVFLTVPQNGEPPADYVECPFYSRGVQCHDCQLCQGTSKPAVNIFVRAHAKVGLNHKWGHK